MNRPRVRSVARMTLYLAAACLAAALVLAVRVYQGGPGTMWSFMLAVVAVAIAMPAGYALAMAR